MGAIIAYRFEENFDPEIYSLGKNRIFYFSYSV